MRKKRLSIGSKIIRRSASSKEPKMSKEKAQARMNREMQDHASSNPRRESGTDFHQSINLEIALCNLISEVMTLARVAIRQEASRFFSTSTTSNF